MGVSRWFLYANERLQTRKLCTDDHTSRVAKIAEKLAENGGALPIIAHGQSWPAPVICAVSARLFGVNAPPISDLSLYPKSR